MSVEKEGYPPDGLSDLAYEVQSAITEVLPSADPLDASNFDAVEYLNSRFASERALGHELEPLILEVSNQIGILDDEISAAVHAQAEAGARASRDICEARAAMDELGTKIIEIKVKAEESEAIVREICREIKSLDTAKRNLQTTMTALKRMHMLTAAVSQLRSSSAAKRYGEAANLLQAIGHLLAYFEPHGDVPRISELKAEVAATRKRLEDEVFEAFNKIGRLAETTTSGLSTGNNDTETSLSHGEFASLSDACLVLDAVGPAARDRQMAALVQSQLEPYGQLFPRGGQYSSLEDVDRRFSWIRRLLRAFQERYHQAFPVHWYMERRLIFGFVEETRSMFLAILSSGEDHSVTAILKALQKSLVFEKEVQARLDDLDHKRSVDTKQQHSSSAAEEKSIMPLSADNLDFGGNNPPNVFDKDNTNTLNPNTKKILGSVLGTLSSVFDPFMQPYVALEKKNMEDMMSKIAAEEDVDRDGALPVFSSSVHVFAYIKTSVRRCTALTTGQTFYKLYQAFGECLTEYANRLTAAVDEATVHSSAKEESRRNFWASQDAVSVASYALNTAEYCADTMEQLGDIVKAKIDKEYIDQIETEPQIEAFREVIARAVRKLVAVVDAALEPALKRLAATNWSTLDSVDEESKYVGDIVFALRSKVPAARTLLSALYFRNVCDKIVAAFLPKLYKAILNAKRINETATHQLLLDLHSLKPLLLDLPNIAPVTENTNTNIDNGSAPTNDSKEAHAGETARIKPAITFTKFVTKQLAKTEMLLKLVGTPTEMLVERFKIMWPDGTRSDLLAVCALKGLKRSEQLALADTFSGGGAFGSSTTNTETEAAANPATATDPATHQMSFVDRAAFESKFESVSATASLTINKAASQMRDLINMQRGGGDGKSEPSPFSAASSNNNTFSSSSAPPPS